VKLAILQLDTLDDRREVHSLLARLPPRDRVRFLSECCSRVPQSKGKLPVPVVTHLRETIDRAYRCDRSDERLTNELYGDLLGLFNAWGLDVAATVRLLTEWVRRPDLRRASSSPSGSPSAAPARTPCSTGSGRRRC
jgi:hypothetical protein